MEMFNEPNESELKNQTLAFHEEHIEEFRGLVDAFGTQAGLARKLGRSNAFIANIVNENSANSHLRPETYFAVKYILLSQAWDQIHPKERQASEPEELKRDFTALSRRMAHLS